MTTMLDQAAKKRFNCSSTFDDYGEVVIDVTQLLPVLTFRVVTVLLQDKFEL